MHNQQETTEWLTSSYSAGGQCFELRRFGDEIWVRSTEGGPMIQETPEALGALIQGVKGGEFDHLIEGVS